MKASAPPNFECDGATCRWQMQPPDAWPVACAWLADVAGTAVAGHLQRDPRGRPRLPAGMGDIGWSHTGGRLLLAYTASGTIGVDIERADRRVHPLRIARRYFSGEETMTLATLDDAARAPAFLHLWCAKEAVLKAHGHGLAFGLDRVTLGLDGGGLRMLRCDAALGAVADWRLQAFMPEPGYMAVVAQHDGILHP